MENVPSGAETVTSSCRSLAASRLAQMPGTVVGVTSSALQPRGSTAGSRWSAGDAELTTRRPHYLLIVLALDIIVLALDRCADSTPDNHRANPGGMRRLSSRRA